ncbi:unnamed protein product [Gadus morhua 'NCC']
MTEVQLQLIITEVRRGASEEQVSPANEQIQEKCPEQQDVQHPLTIQHDFTGQRRKQFRQENDLAEGFIQC